MFYDSEPRSFTGLFFKTRNFPKNDLQYEFMRVYEVRVIGCVLLTLGLSLLLFVQKHYLVLLRWKIPMIS